jgi:predicted NBD/HSP70 family sugar kinase
MVITLDIGGTKMRLAAFHHTQDPQNYAREEISHQGTYEQDLQTLVATIQQISGAETLEGIGLSVAGILTPEKTGILNASNLSYWNNHNLKADLRTCFPQATIKLENDTVCAALAEARFGNHAGEFLLVIWGTGTGGTLVTYPSGKLSLDQCELGHQIVDLHGRECGCGQRGCLEQYVSGGPLRQRFGFDLNLTEENWAEVSQRFAQGLTSVMVFHPVKSMVWAGGMTIHFPEKLELIHQKLAQQLKVYAAPPFEISQFGDDIGLIGALALLQE